MARLDARLGVELATQSSEEARVVELDRVDVDAHHGLEALGTPACELRQGLLDHPVAEAQQQGVAGEVGDERRREQQAALRVLPADERLEADEVAATQVDLGLVVQDELPALEGPLDLTEALVALARVLVVLEVEEVVAVLSRELRLVHRLMGLPEKLLCLRPTRVINEGEPDAGRDADLPTVDDHRRLDDVEEPAGRRGPGVGPVEPPQHGDELVAGHAREEVVVAQRGTEALPDLAQQLVTDLASVALVDGAEVVDVEVGDGDPLALARPRERVDEQVGEVAAVRQARQRVVGAGVAQLLPALALLADVDVDADEQGRVALVGPLHDPAERADPDPAALVVAQTVLHLEAVAVATEVPRQGLLHHRRVVRVAERLPQRGVHWIGRGMRPPHERAPALVRRRLPALEVPQPRARPSGLEGGLEALALVLELPLVAVALGDAAQVEHEHRLLAAGREAVRRRLELLARARPRAETVLEGQRARTVVEMGPQPCLEVSAVVGVQQLAQRPGEHIDRRVAEDGPKGTVDVAHVEVGVEHDDRVAEAIDDRAEPGVGTVAARPARGRTRVRLPTSACSSGHGRANLLSRGRWQALSARRRTTARRGGSR